MFEIFLIDMITLAGPEKFGSLRDGYYVNAKYAIIAFELTSRCSYKNLPSWIRDVKRVSPQCEIIIVGTKSDLPRKLSLKSLPFFTKRFLPYFESSSKVIPHFNIVIPWYFALLDTCVSCFVKNGSQ